MNVNHHAGGLEITTIACSRPCFVNHHAGGLETPKTQPKGSFKR